jgi:uncharacterized phage protein (TIGR02218 family)
MSSGLIDGHVLVPELPDWQSGVSLSRRWETEIGETVTGAEDRGALRHVPRLELAYGISTLTQAQRARFEDRLREALKSGKAAVPFWGRASDLATDASGMSAELATTNWPWQVGDYIFFLDATDLENPVHAVRQITGKTGLSLTLNSALPQTFAAGSLVWPLLFGKPEAEDQSLVTTRQSFTGFRLMELTGSTRSSAASAPAYLSRPIFTTPINWTDGVSQRLSYDLRELSIGFGAEVFAPLQSHVVHGFEFSVQLNTETEILALENFFAALHGRLHGFWLPAPTEAVDIVSGISATQFDIAGQGFADTWNEHPAMHLWFTTAAGANAAAKILSVTDNGDGTERVTLESALSFTPDATTMVSRLHYVRLTDDEESADFLAEWFEQRSLQVLELPTEYAEAETGEQPVYLYDIWIATSPAQHWYYTSFASDITSNGQTYLAKAITHGSVKASIEGSTDKLTLESVHEAGHPLLFGFPFPPSRPIQVRVSEIAYGAPDTATILFTGQVEQVTRRGKQLSAECVSILDLDTQRLPDALIGPRCAYQVYDANCGADRDDFKHTATLTTIVSERVIQVTHATAFEEVEAQHYTFGWLETGTGAELEIRSILADTVVSATVRQLTLDLPLQYAQVGDAITLLPGCDGKWLTCRTKFKTYNFMGHPFVPVKNPTLAAVEQPVSQGGKK